MDNHNIFGVHITERLKHASEVQKVLTEFGCYIKTRLGLHEASPTVCSPNGLLILEMVGEQAKIDECGDKLNAIEGVELKKIFFDHP